MAESDEDWGGLDFVAAVDDPGATPGLTQSESDEDWTGEAGAASKPPAEPEVEAPPPDDMEDVVDSPVAPRKMTRAEVCATARAKRAANRAERLGLPPPPGPPALDLVAVAPVADVASSSALVPRDEASPLSTTLCRLDQSSGFRSFLKSAGTHAEESGIHKTNYRKHLLARGQAMLRGWRQSCMQLVQKCVGAGAAEDLGAGPPTQAKLFVRQRKYDETNSVLACWWNQGPGTLDDLGQLLDLEVGPTKVFVVEAKAAMLFHRTGGGSREGADATAALGVSWRCPSLLQAVERNSGECYAVALEQACGQDYDDLVDSKFARQVDVICTDAHPANLKAERTRKIGHPLPARLHLLCDAHKAAAVATKTFHLWKELPTKVIQLALATKGGIATLRRHVREIIRERLAIEGGVSSREAAEHRAAMAKLFLPEHRPKESARRVVMLSLFNGDWREAGKIVHHTTGEIGGGAKEILHAFLTWGTPALLPRTLKVFARSNWTGSGASLADIGLLLVVHNILPAAFSRAFAEKPPPAAPARAASARRLPLPAPPAGGDDDNADGSSQEDWGGMEAPAGAAEQDLKDSWKEQRQQHIRGTAAWLQSGTASDDLVKARMVHQQPDRMILAQLKVTGSEWEFREQQRLKREGARKYRPLVSHDGQSVHEYFDDAESMLFQEERWKWLLDKSQAVQLHLFRLLTRGAACTYQLLHCRHRWYPYRLFDLLRSDRTRNHLQDQPACVLDEYTDNFRTFHGDDMRGAFALQELQLVGQLADTDTASTERLHSENQRRGKFRVWTHPSDMASLSVWYVARSHRRELMELGRHRSEDSAERQMPLVDRRGDGPVLPVQKKARRGGGGAWRAYCHMHGKGRKFDAAVAAELSAGYAALTADERAKYESLGSLATDVHKDGHKAFGPRDRTSDQRTLHATPARGAGAIQDVAGRSGVQVHPKMFSTVCAFVAL